MSDDGPGPLFTALRVEGPADMAQSASAPLDPIASDSPGLPSLDEVNSALSEAASLEEVNSALSEAAWEMSEAFGGEASEPNPDEPKEARKPLPASLRRHPQDEPPSPPPVVLDPGAPIEEHLERLFGFTSFRPGQREIIDSVLAGRDTLAVMPTGGGKSLTYLLPAFLSEKATIVISPLISLMQDQVSKLRALGLDAAALNSQLSYADRSAILEDLKFGRLKVLFVAPERFRDARFLRVLEHVEVGLLAVDEAHCVSQWGHDFRPDYLCLDEAARHCGRPPILAVTATATDRVRLDIVKQLGLKDPLVLVRGFDRENLFLSGWNVFGGQEAKIRSLFHCIRRAPKGPGIVYCATRKNTERVARRLRAAKLGKVGVYHAGLGALRREREQDKFFAGQTDIVVATNAFGLGIDKQDLRFVIHHDLPGSVEAYYQEAGRAGRDGEPAECALLFAMQDIHLQKFFITSSHPERSLVLQVDWASRKVGNDPDRIADALPRNASAKAVSSALRLIEQAGGRADNVDFAAVNARAQHEQQMLERMIRYAKGGTCRRRSILNYFGAPDAPAGCDACDVCRPPKDRPKTAGKSSKKSTSRKKGTRKRKSASKTSAAPPRDLDAPGDAELLGLLRRMRTKFAKKKRWKPYQVFNDRTMLAIAAARPKNREELLEIHGIAEKKVAQFGDAILEAVAKIG